MDGVVQNVFRGDLKTFLASEKYSQAQKLRALEDEISRLRSKAMDDTEQLGSGEAAQMMRLIHAARRLGDG